jgi:3-hydroxybutyryl-CoA dehydratase
MSDQSKEVNSAKNAASELSGRSIEEIEPGMTAVYARTVTEADIIAFAGVSGDDNPVHLNEDFAATTMFKGRIAHGMLSVGYISAVIGTRLPGPGCIYLSQSLRFKAPVSIGDTVTARVTVTAMDRERNRVTLSTVCTVGNKVVIDGEAEVMPPK